MINRLVVIGQVLVAGPRLGMSVNCLIKPEWTVFKTVESSLQIGIYQRKKQTMQRVKLSVGNQTNQSRPVKSTSGHRTVQCIQYIIIVTRYRFTLKLSYETIKIENLDKNDVRWTSYTYHKFYIHIIYRNIFLIKFNIYYIIILI